MNEQTNQFSQRIAEKRYYHETQYWRGECNTLYDSVDSYESVARLLQEGSTNQKILTIEEIVPLITDLITEEEKSRLIGILKELSSDNSMCEISYSAPQSDEEDTTTVAGAAKYAISEIGL